jgi:hypothetical protein
MKKIATITAILALLMLIFTGSVLAAPDKGVPPGQENFKEMDYETIDQGAFSYYKYGDFGFTGDYIVIRSEEDWEEFWDDHKSGIIPHPERPDVEFNKNMVLVALMGSKPTFSFGIGIIKVERHGNTVNAYVEKVEGPGMLPVVTNPYHIIECKKTKNVNFIEI